MDRMGLDMDALDLSAPCLLISPQDFVSIRFQRHQMAREGFAGVWRRTNHSKGDEDIVGAQILDHKCPRAEAEAHDEKGDAGEDEVGDDSRHRDHRDY